MAPSPPSRANRVLGVLVFVLVGLSPRESIHPQQYPYFVPSGNEWFMEGEQVTVYIHFCTGDEQYYLNHTVTFNGQDVSQSFTWNGATSTCGGAMQGYLVGTVTLASGTNTIASIMRAYYSDGADQYWETDYEANGGYTGSSYAPSIAAHNGYNRAVTAFSGRAGAGSPRDS